MGEIQLEELIGKIEDDENRLLFGRTEEGKVFGGCIVDRDVFALDKRRVLFTDAQE